MKACYIGGIQRFSTEDGPGIRTTVFFKGCPLSCQWCHNPELLDSAYAVLYRRDTCIRCGRCIRECPTEALSLNGDQIRLNRSVCVGCGACVRACCTEALHAKATQYSTEELMELLEKDRTYYERSGGGITLSGGEVLAHGEYALEVAREIRRRGLSLAIETCGFGDDQSLLALAKLCDCILYDLKQMDPERHAFYTGVSPELIWRNLERLAADTELRKRIVIRAPLIHGVNDDEKNLTALARYLQQLGLKTIHLLPYHSMGVSKAKEAGMQQKKFETPSDEALTKARELLTAEGLQVTIMGSEQ